MKKAVYAQYVGNADKSAIKRSTLKIIENTGTFARRQSKMDSHGSKYLNNNNEVKSAWSDSKVQENKSNSNSDLISDISSHENSAGNSSGSLGVKQKKSFKSMTNKLITLNRKIFFYLLKLFL